MNSRHKMQCHKIPFKLFWNGKYFTSYCIHSRSEKHNSFAKTLHFLLDSPTQQLTGQVKQNTHSFPKMHHLLCHPNSQTSWYCRRLSLKYLILHIKYIIKDFLRKFSKKNNPYITKKLELQDTSEEALSSM